MKANAWHHRSDAISSGVALLGVGKTLNEGLNSHFLVGKFSSCFRS